MSLSLALVLIGLALMIGVIAGFTLAALLVAVKQSQEKQP